MRGKRGAENRETAAEEAGAQALCGFGLMVKGSFMTTSRINMMPFCINIEYCQAESYGENERPVSRKIGTPSGIPNYLILIYIIINNCNNLSIKAAVWSPEERAPEEA